MIRQRKRCTEFSSQKLLGRLDLFYLNLIRLLVRTAVPHVTFPMTSDGPSAFNSQRLIVRNIVHFVC